jgi:8-oxo-dGTP pyrophosphatase MutT (NUDIX family)
MSHADSKNPELIARACIIQNNKILLCVNATGTKHCFLPGGHIELMETSAEALHREINEELGAEVKNQHFIGIAENFYFDGTKDRHEVNLIYAVELKNYDVQSQEEHLTFEWIPLDTLGNIDARPRSLMEAITKWASDQHFFQISIR